MAHYRSPNTAPRDGTYIVGLFERSGKRAIALLASYDIEDAEPLEVSETDPDWMKEVAESHLNRLRNDPTSFFVPCSSDADSGYEVGRMIGWRPARPPT